MLVVVVEVVVVAEPPPPPEEDVVVVADDVVVVVDFVRVKTFDSVVSPSRIIAWPVPVNDPAVMFHTTDAVVPAPSESVCVAGSLPSDVLTANVFDLFW